METEFACENKCFNAQLVSLTVDIANLSFQVVVLSG